MEPKAKKYIIIKSDNGEFIKRRVLTTYSLETTKKEYVIFYDDSDAEIRKFCIASYDEGTNFKNINTNLSEFELKSADILLEKIKEML